MREPMHKKNVFQCTLELRNIEEDFCKLNNKKEYSKCDIKSLKDPGIGAYVFTGLINEHPTHSFIDQKSLEPKLEASIKFLALRYKDCVFEYIKTLSGDEKKAVLEKLFSTNPNERNEKLRNFFLEKRGFFNPNEKSGTLGELRKEYDKLNSSPEVRTTPSSPST